jgi:hypothetical protein
MKIRRNQLILIIAVISVIGYIYMQRTERYTTEESKNDLINYIKIHEVPDTVFVLGVIESIGGVSDELKTQIIDEVDKGDLGDQNKMIELIKKI